MQLERARIRNFRSLRDVEVVFGAHTALIGGNGAGKSSILKAIEKFYSTTKNCDADDFFGRDQGQPIEIELTFHQLSEQEAAAFEDRVRMVGWSSPAFLTEVHQVDAIMVSFHKFPTSSLFGLIPQPHPSALLIMPCARITHSTPTFPLLAVRQRSTRRC